MCTLCFNTAGKIALETGSQRLKGVAALRRPAAAPLLTLSENKVKVSVSLIDAQLDPTGDFLSFPLLHRRQNATPGCGVPLITARAAWARAPPAAGGEKKYTLCN